MAYCRKCGEEISELVNHCPVCGADQTTIQNNGHNSNASGAVDTGGFGWGLLGFCVPVAGLILYLVWQQDRPLTAKAAGTGALIGFILNIIAGFIWGFSLAALAS